MKGYELEKLGIQGAEAIKVAHKLLRGPARKMKKAELRDRLGSLARDPSAYLEDPDFGELARALTERPQPEEAEFVERDRPAPWKQWGEGLEDQAVQQMVNACRLPVAVRGALMPDAHVGYGLPIGGVLATENAVIPYAVGVDIACRMRMTVLDMPAEALRDDQRELTRVLEGETRFGVGAEFKRPREHRVLSLDWSVTPVTHRLKRKAEAQLGTSGSGNHFVEFGVLTLDRPELGLTPGKYLALLSHSGSRGAGAEVAAFYSRLARDLHPELPKELSYLAWLDLDRPEGQEYWAAMELMGEYAKANHEVIHREVVRALKARSLVSIENHHNFAWKELHDGRELIVHRKGATPADLGVLGIIPGSMATPAFVVRGKGNEEALKSAAHGAGRVMSRTQALKTFKWSDVKRYLVERGVTLLSSGLDEVPMVYKDIHQVMDFQHDLVDRVARFQPKLVKMAPAGERPED